MDTKLEVAVLQESVAKTGITSRMEFENWFTAETLGVSGTLYLLNWRSCINSRTKLSKHLVDPNMQTGQLEPLLSQFTEEEELQHKFNVEKPLIFNTYQYYLKDAYDNVTLYMELAHHEGWCFGAKLVWGAYMAQEHTCTTEISYEDPINPMYQATKAVYHRMEELDLYPANRQVYFGQLLGMCGQISFPVGQAGFPVYKYVPYGPVMEMLP
ncbi:hypothetical protein GH733_017361 [Mirounga leonina]|nr:hypothetical protein GH733_017361 [Mirounga leonina]